MTPRQSLPLMTMLCTVFLALPALAQPMQTAGNRGFVTAACGQPEALTWRLSRALDDTPAAPLALTMARNEPAYLEFTLDAEARVALRTETASGDTDPYLALYAAGGALIAQDDDSGGGYNAMLDATLAPGTYCAQMRPYGSGAQDQQMTLLAATGDAAAELAARPGAATAPDLAELCADPALTADLAPALGPGFGRIVRTASVAPGGRQDWRFEVSETMALQFDTANSTFDTMLLLAGPGGGYVADNDDGPDGTDSRIVAELAPGSYCLSLAGYAGEGGRAELSVLDAPEFPLLGDITTACTDPALTSLFGTTLGPGAGGTSVSGILGPQSRSDWLIEIAGSGRYQFDLASESFDAYLTLLDSAGRVVAENDDGPFGVDSRIVETLPPGSYCLAAAALGPGSGDFELSATGTPDPEPFDSFGTALCAAPEITGDLGADIGPGLGRYSLPVSLDQGARRDLRFEVTAPVPVIFEARSDAFDTVIRIGSATGVILHENDDGPEGTDSRLELTLEPGRYCLSLDSFAGNGGAAEIALTELDAAQARRMAVARGERPPGPEDGVEIEDLGPLDGMRQANALTPAPTKWAAFTMPGPGPVRIDAVSASGSFALRLFAEDGRLMSEASGFAGLAPTTIEADLAPGRYFIGMVQAGGPGISLRNITVSRR